MKQKQLRQKQIKQILEKKIITTQFQLQKFLRQAGYEVTQATLSRDLKELGVNYVRGPDGKYSYKLTPSQTSVPILQDLKSRFSNYVVDITYTGNLILIKTLPGEAAGTARLIDELLLFKPKFKKFEKVLGTIAGDDTILMVIKHKSNVAQIIKFLNSMKGGVS